MKDSYLIGGYDDEFYVMPFEGGLTSNMASARNPLIYSFYRFIKNATVVGLDVNASINIYVLMGYRHMKVCACVLACGLNRFDYAVLWKQY